MGGIKTKLDLEQLKIEINNLTPDKKLYLLLKNELGKIGHWKQLKRGKPNIMFTKK